MYYIYAYVLYIIYEIYMYSYIHSIYCIDYIYSEDTITCNKITLFDTIAGNE